MWQFCFCLLNIENLINKNSRITINLTEIHCVKKKKKKKKKTKIKILLKKPTTK